MFDGILGRGFAPKGKPLIKLAKNKIDVLRRKRMATIKFLKKDLADLIVNGLDVNAYSRAGGLLDELRLLWNLDFVENTCDFVYKQLSTMQKIAECPEDCREAVSSLMFAASGYSELPELRELRQMFQEKYGDSLVLFVNQELVESMSSKPFSMEKKVKLMEDIALEFSIRWDSKSFEKRLMRHNSSSVKEKDTYGTPNANHKYKHVDRNLSLPNRDEFGLSSKERFERLDDGHSLNRKTADASERRDPLFQPAKEIYGNVLRGNQHGLTSKERSENVLRTARSESKDVKAERKELYVQSKQEPSKKRHEPIFNEGDTIVMKIKRENDQHGILPKGRSDNASHTSRSESKDSKTERKEFHLQSSKERHEPIFNEGDTIVMKIKRENLAQGNGHRNGEADLHKKTEVIASEKPKPSSTKKADKLVLGFKQESFFQGYKHENHEEHGPQKVEDNISRPPKPNSKSKRAESIDAGPRHRNDRESKENVALVGKSAEEDPSGGIIKGGENEYGHSTIVKILEERETERMKSSVYKSLPPPYVKPSGKAKKEKAEASVSPKARFGAEEGNDADIDKNVSGVERGNEVGDHEGNEALKRRSNRRKHILHSGADDDTRSQRRENSREGLQVLIDENEKDSEEKMMDKLLMHYSKKPSSYDNLNLQKEPKSRRSHPKKGEDGETIPQPARSRSLPSEQCARGPSEAIKTFARASSFQPERSSEAKHVHPKLPNYDDLAARFAELKGR